MRMKAGFKIVPIYVNAVHYDVPKLVFSVI